MANNPVHQLNELHKSFISGEIDRRTLLVRAGGLGLSAYALNMFTRGISAGAQDATPASTGGYKSKTREEWQSMVAQEYPFTSKDAQPAQGGTVILGDTSTANLTTVNPLFADNFPTQDIVFQAFEQLTSLNPQGGAEFGPALCDSFEIADDGKTYTFHLNPNAKFHNGDPLTADDIVFTCDLVANDATGTSYTSSFKNTVASYRSIDEHTLEVVATDVMSQIVFFPNFFHPVISKKIWEGVDPASMKTDPGSTGQDPSRVVGSGPFKFDSINEGEGTATFVKNADYYDKVPNIDKFIFQTWPDETAIVEALRTNALDAYMESVPPSDVADLQAEDNLDVALYDTYQVAWYGYNLDPAHTTLFQDKAVRQALIIGLDRQSIVTNIYLDYSVVAKGTQPLLSEAYAPDEITVDYTYNPDKAKQMLDAAGWAAGSDGIRAKDGQKLSFQITYASGSATSDQAVAAIQDNWKAIGVDGQPNAVDFDTVMVPALTESFDYEVILLGFDWASPSGDQTAMFGTASYGGGFNAMKYSNPQYDDLMAQANKELDIEKRRELLVQATNIVTEDAPVCILWFRKDRIGYNVRLKNFTPTANGLLWSLPFVEAPS